MGRMRGVAGDAMVTRLQGNCATTCCTNSRSGQAPPKARMHFKFRADSAGGDLLFQIAYEGGVSLRVHFGGRLDDLIAARRGFERRKSHAAIFMRFLASIARTNLSHFAMAARFSGM